MITIRNYDFSLAVRLSVFVEAVKNLVKHKNYIFFLINFKQKQQNFGVLNAFFDVKNFMSYCAWASFSLREATLPSI